MLIAATQIENFVRNGRQPVAGQHDIGRGFILDDELAEPVLIEGHVAVDVEAGPGRPRHRQLQPLEVLLACVAVPKERPFLRAHHDSVPFHLEIRGLQTGLAVEERALHTHFIVGDVLRVQVRVFTGGVESRGASGRLEGLGVGHVEVQVDPAQPPRLPLFQEVVQGAELRAERVERLFAHRHANREGLHVLEVQSIEAARSRQVESRQRGDLVLVVEAVSPQPVFISPELEILPIGPRRWGGVEEVDGHPEGPGIREDEIPAPEPRIRLEGNPGQQLIVEVSPGWQQRDAGLLVEDLLVGLERERIHGERAGHEIERCPNDVARLLELVLDVPKGGRVGKGEAIAEISGVVRRQPQLLLMEVGGRQVDVGQQVELWLDVAQQLATHDRHAGGQRIVGRDAVDRDPRFGLVVRCDRELGEDRSLVHVISGVSGVEPVVATRRPGQEVASPVPERARRADSAPDVAEFSELQLRGEPGLSRGHGGDDVDRTADGGPPIQRRIGAVDDFYGNGMIDGEVDHARAVPRIGLRHAVDEQQGGLELVPLSWHSPELDRFERVGLGGVHEAGRVLERIHELEITPRFDILAVDHGGQGRNLRRALGRLHRGHDESLHLEGLALHGDHDAGLGSEGHRQRGGVKSPISQGRDLKLVGPGSHARDPELPARARRHRIVGPGDPHDRISDRL